MQYERTFPASRTKALFLLCASLIFVALGWAMAAQKPLIGWACVAFFGLGIPAAIIMMIPGVMHLRLDGEGVELKSIVRSQKILWRDVKSFRVASIRGTKMIAIEYQPSYARQRAARAAASAISGMEGAIPNSYSVSIDKLANELNEWRARYGQA